MVTSPEHVDVLIVGAGLSGIGAACQLREHLPTKSVAVLEAREASGGTWDLFKYPGIRSDSDMFTFGFGWRPWPGDRALADGPSILDYLRTVAAEYGVDELIRYRHKVTGASWDSETALWTVEIDHDGDADHADRRASSGAAAGYYHYDEPYAPEFPGADSFEGTIVHPQHWPEDLDYAGKRVVVIGSGATAVTLVPAMAETAGHVTMLQRSPTYILSRPARDRLATRARQAADQGVVPGGALGQHPAHASAPTSSRRRRPELREGGSSARPSTAQLPDAVDVDVHFKPRYNPWDQRFCFVPDGDLFRALRKGQASIVTDTIETFTPKGIRLTSGAGARGRHHRDRDRAAGAAPSAASTWSWTASRSTSRQTMAYKALMLSGVPNFAYTVGYTNASWTLKADLVSAYVVRLLQHLDGPAPGRRCRCASRTSTSSRSWTSRPATSCGRWTGCPSRATGSRGGSSRTT